MISKYLAFLPAYLLILMLFFSCGTMIRKNFTVYKEAPHQQATIAVPVNGIFFLRDFVRTKYYEPPFAFFLYEDGTIISYNGAGTNEATFWQNPDAYLKSMRLPTNEEGHYKVDGDKIFFETFAINPGSYFAPLKIIRFEGRVINDSAILIEKVICDWCYKKVDTFPKDGVLFVDNMFYKFYPTPIRPDSNTIWFKKKKWYQENVWYRKK